jgi:hypothetical protein
VVRSEEERGKGEDVTMVVRGSEGWVRERGEEVRVREGLGKGGGREERDELMMIASLTANRRRSSSYGNQGLAMGHTMPGVGR